MRCYSAALVAACTLGLISGICSQEINSTDPATTITTTDIIPNEDDSTRTTILFSGFYFPTTTTLLPTVQTSRPSTNLPEPVQTVHQDDDEVRTVQQDILNTTKLPDNSIVQNETRSPPKPLRVIEIHRPSVQESIPTNVPIEETIIVSKKTEHSQIQRNIPKIRNPNNTEQVVIDRRAKKDEISVNLVTEEKKRTVPRLPFFELEKESVEYDPSEEEMPYDLESRRLVEEHPCRRECRPGKPMTCRYAFKVEWYESLSKACFNCPSNMSDCFRADCIPTDGFQRPLTVVNRKFPGPSIEVCLGDSLEILLENRLMSETTTVHWHGLHQRESPYMDGVPFVSQCPVSPRSNFLYRYTAANVGTHFWHSHSGVQRADGMFGALIVRSPVTEPDAAAAYDEDLSEHIIQLIDWSHGATIGVFTGHHHARTDNKPPTLLVNGRGVYAGAPPASFTVTKGLRYRFRLINAGVLNCPVELTIDNHTLTIIASDGTQIQPVQADSLVSYAGERWDFILSTDAPIDNYWMRFRGLMDCDQRFTSAQTVAVLHYAGSPNRLPSSPFGYNIGFRKGLQVNPLNEKESEPSLNVNELQSHQVPSDPSLKKIPDRKVILSYDFNPIDNEHLYKKGVYGFYEVADRRERVLTPQFNHVALALPPFPLLSQYQDLRPEAFCRNQDLSNCSRKYCECLNVVDLNLGEVVELIFIDRGDAYDANHPFHLHGHAFRVIAMDRLGKSTSVSEILELEARGGIRRNLVDPPLKDTVTVPDGGYTVVRFIADNPGYWMLHCHLEFHVELGMAIIFKVGEHSDFPPVPPGFPKCGDYLTPPLTGENEIYWSYNTTQSQGTSFTLTDWWPLNRDKNSSPQNKSSLILNILGLFLFLSRILD